MPADAPPNGVIHPVFAPALPFPPPPIPSDWELAPPDFVGVGAMRSGTTWWWSLLQQHPDIAHVGDPAPELIELGFTGALTEEPYVNKEFHFFDHYGGVETVDPKSYARYFPRPPGRICGEWTPRYMYDFWTPPMLHEVAPEARVLVLLRDPLDRFVSGLARHAGWAGDPTLRADQFARGLYWRQLRNLLSYFSRDRVLVLQYERCKADTLAELRRTFRFLGLDPDRHRPGESDAEHGGRFDGRARVPVGIASDGSTAPTVAEKTLHALRVAYRPDLERLLAEFPEIDPRLWRTVNR